MKFLPIIFLILGFGSLVGCWIVFTGGHSELYGLLVFLGLWGLAMIYGGIRGLVKIRRGTFLYSSSVGRRGFDVNEASGVANIFYSPAKNTEEQFLKEVALFSGRTMDKIGRNKKISQINVWAEGQIILEDGQKIVKRVSLTLNKENWQGPAIGGLLNFATSDQQSYFRHCSLKDVSEGEIPELKTPRPFPG